MRSVLTEHRWVVACLEDVSLLFFEPREVPSDLAVPSLDLVWPGGLGGAASVSIPTRSGPLRRGVSHGAVLSLASDLLAFASIRGAFTRRSAIQLTGLAEHLDLATGSEEHQLVSMLSEVEAFIRELFRTQIGPNEGSDIQRTIAEWTCGHAQPGEVDLLRLEKVTGDALERLVEVFSWRIGWAPVVALRGRPAPVDIECRPGRTARELAAQLIARLSRS